MNDWLNHPRRLLALISVACIGFLGFGLYLQYSLGLEPCPMCVVQRYLFIFVAVFSALGVIFGRAAGARLLFRLLVLMSAVLGAFVAARQSWLQWNPPEFATCGRDIYGMIESFPLSRAVPMIFAGSGDCVAIDWTFLGLSIANWSFVCFAVIGLLVLFLLLRRQPQRALA